MFSAADARSSFEVDSRKIERQVFDNASDFRVPETDMLRGIYSGGNIRDVEPVKVHFVLGGEPGRVYIVRVDS